MPDKLIHVFVVGALPVDAAAARAKIKLITILPDHIRQILEHLLFGHGIQNPVTAQTALKRPELGIKAEALEHLAQLGGWISCPNPIAIKHLASLQKAPVAGE